MSDLGPGVERMKGDAVSIADTRPAMKGGVPFWALFPIFFAPSVVVVLTWNVFWMVWIPVLWVLCKLAYARNPNRPFEWVLYVVSGAWLADWTVWGGQSHDPHEGAAPWAGL